MIFVRTKNFLITKGKFLPAIWRQSEAQHRHAGDQEAGDDQVGEVVHRPPPDLDGEGDVQVWLRTTLVDHLITNCWNSWERERWSVLGFRLTCCLILLLGPGSNSN